MSLVTPAVYESASIPDNQEVMSGTYRQSMYQGVLSTLHRNCQHLVPFLSRLHQVGNKDFQDEWPFVERPALLIEEK